MMNGPHKRRSQRSGGSKPAQPADCEIGGASARCCSVMRMMRPPRRRCSFRQRKGFTITRSSLKAGMRGGGWPINLPISFCSSEEATCYRAARRQRVLSQRRWRVGQKSVPFLRCSQPFVTQMARRFSSTPSRRPVASRVSEVHATLTSRVSREPLAIARVLANRYPQNPIVSYIPVGCLGKYPSPRRPY